MKTNPIWKPYARQSAVSWARDALRAAPAMWSIVLAVVLGGVALAVAIEAIF